MITDAEAAPATSPRPVGEWFEGMPLTGAHWLAGGTLFVAFVIEAWEMMILILNAGAIAAEFGIGTEQVGFLISALFLGMIPGSIIWGRWSDVYGRKRSLVLSVGLYTVFPFFTAIAPSYEALWAIRFACGIVLSGALVVTFPLFTELLPVRVRGPGTVFLSAGWPVGMLGAIGITALLASHGWRWALGFSTLLGLWSFVIWALVPESPYWLAERGRIAEADRTIDSLSKGAVRSHAAAPGGEAVTTSLLGIFAPGVLIITSIQTVINFCFSWGYWGLTSWIPSLLAERGLSSGEGLGFLALSALFMFPGYVAASILTGRFGRKKVMTVFVFFATVAGFGFAYSQTVTQLYVWNFALSFFSLGAWGVWNTWLGEIYATRTRAQGVAWGIMIQRVANAVAPIAIGAVLAGGSFLLTVSFISLFLAGTFVAALFLPETEGEILT